MPVTFVAGSQAWQIKPQRARRRGGLGRRGRRGDGEGRRLEPRSRLPADRAPPLSGRRRALGARLQQRRRSTRSACSRRTSTGRTATRGSCGTACRSSSSAGRSGGSSTARRRPGSWSPRSPARRASRSQLPVEADPPKVTVAQLRRVRARATRVVSGAGHAEDRHRQLRRRAEAARGDAASFRAAARRDLTFGGPAAERVLPQARPRREPPAEGRGLRRRQRRHDLDLAGRGRASRSTSARRRRACSPPRSAPSRASRSIAVGTVAARALDGRGEGDGDHRRRRLVRDDLRRHREPHPQRAARRAG